MISIDTAFIPAAGYGTRLLPLTKNHQKCCLPVWEHKIPLIIYNIWNLAQIGCKHFVVAINHCANEVTHCLNNILNTDIDIEYVKGNFVGTYDTLYQGLSLLPDCFYYQHGDMVCTTDMYKLLLNQYNLSRNNVIGIVPSDSRMTHPQVVLNGKTLVDSIYFLSESGENIASYMHLGASIYQRNDIIQYASVHHERNGLAEQFLIPKVQTQEVNYILYQGEWEHLMDSQDYARLMRQTGFIDIPTKFYVSS